MHCIFLHVVKLLFFIWCEKGKCTLSLPSNIALGWHAVAITLEDYPASTTNFQSATPYSHVSLQFLVHVSPSSGPCNRAPVLIGQSPNDGSCEEVSNGNTFNSVIEAKHIDSSRRYVLLLYPSNAKSGWYDSDTFSWTLFTAPAFFQFSCLKQALIG